MSSNWISSRTSRVDGVVTNRLNSGFGSFSSWTGP